MYITKTKAESRELIKKLNLNTVPEIFIDKSDINSMKSFFSSYIEELYIMRDAEHSSAKYYYVHNLNECIEAANNFSGTIILAVSINTYKNKILLGAIEVSEKCDRVKICATTDSTKDHRTMYNNPEFDLDVDIFDKQLNNIPEFDSVYSYICNNKLLDQTVEFTIYDKNVGTNNERILINEVRNY